MKIYSGECENGTCGLETNLIDARENPLKIGDIVSTANKDETTGNFSFYGLSAVVEDRPHYVGESLDRGPFIMGLRSVDINTSQEWIINRVKKWEDAIDGERWADYGFNFKL